MLTAPWRCAAHCHMHYMSGCLADKPQWPFPEVMRDGLSGELKQGTVAPWQRNFVFCVVCKLRGYLKKVKKIKIVFMFHHLFQEKARKSDHERATSRLSGQPRVSWVHPPGAPFPHAPEAGAGGLAPEFSQGDCLENVCSSYQIGST